MEVHIDGLGIGSEFLALVIKRDGPIGESLGIEVGVDGRDGEDGVGIVNIQAVAFAEVF
ncbi:hypothetical protein BN903_373 [Halorubrum sp. AJ67]|nr:hypothetical protein BN903_373 [Halorubrum sp. AJ67]